MIGAESRSKSLLNPTALIELKIAVFCSVSLNSSAQDALAVDEHGSCNASTHGRIEHVDPAFLIHPNIPIDSIAPK